ncbi:MAG: VanZ family protein, partial [Caryophanon sp.]|nr:VanZ family protein [Caryophanon sp.]
ILAIFSVFVLGCLDEYRQSFSPDRTGTIKDVYIDTTGAIVFVTIAYLLYKVVQKTRQPH